MAYVINRYNTAQLTVVEDGTIDQVTDLKLVGKNYAGYGEIQNCLLYTSPSPRDS